MKFAFSTSSCPQWDFPTIAARAKEYGYDGVEIEIEAMTRGGSAGNLREVFGSTGVGIACLSTEIAMVGKKGEDAAQAEALRRHIDAARQVGCPLVKVLDTQVRPGQSAALVGAALGEWLLPLGDYAAERQVMIVVENALSFRTAAELWTVMDRLNHPSVAVCWDLFKATVIGEPPSVSVPVLNTRIQHVHVSDAKLGAQGMVPCKLGEGDVPIRKMLIRLLGIGFPGYVTLAWDKALLSAVPPAEQMLPDAIGKLRQWIKPPVDESKVKKPEKAPGAAKDAKAEKPTAKSAAEKPIAQPAAL